MAGLAAIGRAGDDGVERVILWLNTCAISGSITGSIR
jgi:hypothetical protein